MTHSTAFQYGTYPIESVNFRSKIDSFVWRQNVAIIVDMHDNPGRHMSEGMDHVSLCMELLECIECFIGESGRALMPLVICKMAHKLRAQFNLPRWSWLRLIIVTYDDDGVAHPSVPPHVDNMGSAVEE